MGPEQEQKVGRNKDFFILLISVFFIYTYNNVFMMATPLLLMNMGSTEMIVGLQATLFLVTAIFLRFLFGPLTDVYGQRLAMLLGSAAFLIAAVLLFYAVEIWQVVALRLVQAIGLASYFPAATATASICAGSDQKGKYIGILRMVASLTLMVGPVLGLFLIRNYSYALFLQSMAIIAFLGMAIIFFITIKTHELKEIEGKKTKVVSRQNFGFLKLLQKGFFIIISTFIAAMSFGILLSFVTLYIDGYTKIVNAGFFFTLFSLGGIFANGVFGWSSDLFGRLRLTIYAFISLGVGIILIAFLPQITALFYPAGFLAGAGYYGSITVLMAWMTEKSESQERTSALSLQQNALDFGIAAGSGIFGVLLVVTNSPNLLYGVLGAFYVGYAILVFLIATRKGLARV